VLKGPQALFFGKNSPAGVVAISTTNPGHEFGGYVRAGHEFKTDTNFAEGAVSVPLAPTLAVRIAGRYSKMSGGYAYNDSRAMPDPFPGENTFILPGAAYTEGPGTKYGIARGTVAWTPTEAFDATWKIAYADYRDRGGVGIGEVVGCPAGAIHPTTLGVPDPFGDCVLNGHFSNGRPAREVAANFYPGARDDVPYNHSMTRLSTLTLNYRLPGVTLTSVTGYYHEVQNAFDDFTYSTLAQAIDYQDTVDTTWSQEFRAVTTLQGPVNFTLGAFFEHEKLDVFNTDKIAPLGPFDGRNPSNFVLFGPAPPQYVGTYNSATMTAYNRNRTISVFGEANWKIVENLELAAGARWTKERKRTDVGNEFNRFDFITGPVNSPLSPTGLRYHPAEDNKNVSPQVTLTWHPQRNTTLYGAYKTGFLSGGAQNPGTMSNVFHAVGGTATTRNIAAENLALQYLPEKVKGFEVGAKGLILDGRLSGDITVYDYKYTNLQVITFDATTTTFAIHNAGSSRNKGIEAQAVYALNDALSAHASFEYSSLKFISYTGAPCYAGQTAAQGCVPGVPGFGPHQDLSGKKYGGAPFSWNVGLNYTQPDTFLGLTTSAAADLYGYQRTPVNNGEPNTAARGYTLLNASLRFSKPNQGWEVAIIGTNLFNKLYQLTPAGDKPLGTTGTVDASRGTPREVTVQFTQRF